MAQPLSLGQALAANSIPVVLTAAQLTTLTPPAAITGFATETTLSSINSKITTVNTGAVVVSSSALPAGASTSANQTTANSSLSSIDSKIPALGQALAAASVPIVLTATQLSALTPPAAITGFALDSTLSALSAKFPTTLGQTTRLNSLSVTLASDQGTLSTSISGTVTVDSELPTAATPTDADSNVTSIPAVLSRLQGYNGSSWDRLRTGSLTVTSTLTGYLNNLPFAEFLSSPGTLTNGQCSPLLMDTNKNLKVSDSLNDTTNSVLPTIQKKISVSTYSASVYRNAGAANSATIKSSSGNLFSFSIENKNLSARYIQFWDTIVTAGSGTLLEEFLVPGLSQIIIGEDYFTALGSNFATGITFGFSTSSNTFSAATASDQNLQVKYK